MFPFFFSVVYVSHRRNAAIFDFTEGAALQAVSKGPQYCQTVIVLDNHFLAVLNGYTYGFETFYTPLRKG